MDEAAFAELGAHLRYIDTDDPEPETLSRITDALRNPSAALHHFDIPPSLLDCRFLHAAYRL